MSFARRKPNVSKEPEDPWEDVDDESEVQLEPPNSEVVLRAKEEIIDEEISSNASHSRTSSRTRTSSPRKRRYKTVYIAAPGPSPRRISPPAPHRTAEKPPPQSSASKLALPTEHVVDGSIFVVGYALDVFKTAVLLLRKPLSFLVFLWLFATILARISATLRAAFHPLCYIPGISSSAMCMPEGYYSASTPPKWADYPRLVDVQSATLEQLLDESSSGSELALQIKKAEMATTDLVTLVRVSELRSRDMLADNLRQFVDDARTTGRALQKLNSKVNGAVDGIMAVNDYAMHTIEAAHSNSPSVFRRLAPWPAQISTSELITNTFEDSMNYLAATMRTLVVEFELNLHNLNKLEEQLSVLHELVSREDHSISAAHSELLGELWTKVGGNRRALRGYENHLQLLKGLSEWRKRALVHVVSALQTLAQMSEDIENLRERVAAPELVGSRIPVEVHIKSIQSGLERLKESRTKAKARESEAVKKVLGSE
ncbi:hypothetical protein C8J57DRAFT_710708 [Mycena rebaudengoi]|nr:hypothetical protein C8J57DRAFT_710708 [Mycena rebaudengoi]